MTGDYAAKCLEAFEVDLTGLEFRKYFGPECSGPILFWPSDRGCGGEAMVSPALERREKVAAPSPDRPVEQEMDG